MKHVFIINPVAGDGKRQASLRAAIPAACAARGLEYELYETKAAGDARRFAAEYPPEVEARFYAVGGDGTLNELVRGVMARGGGAVGFMPCGSGDDFVRYFADKALFLDLERQLSAAARPVDLVRVGADDYSLNMCNIGVDADTAHDVHRFTRFIPGSFAYTVSLVNRFFLHKLGTQMRVTVDGEVFEGLFVLASFANGKAYGGGYFAAPRARIDDGLLEVCLVKPVRRRQFLSLVGRYKRGEHLDDPDFAPLMHYRRARHIQVELAADAIFCNDGETYPLRSVELTMEPGALQLIDPS